MELLTRYSNRDDLLKPLLDVLQRIAENDQTSEPDLAPEGHTLSRSTKASDRLSTKDIANMIAAFQSGVPKHQLAKHYGMSLSTVKRILRRHGVRRNATI